MKGDVLPEEDHLSRYCRKQYCVGDRITGAAFKLRPTEQYLSVNWLELLCQPNRDKEVTEIRRVLAKKLKLHKRDRIAIGKISAVISHIFRQSADSRRLAIIHEPEPDDPSHSGIYGLSAEDDLMYGELLAEVFEQVYPASD